MPEESEQGGFASRLSQALEARRMNQSELARRLRLRPQSVQKWVSGRSQPRGKRMEFVASALGVPVAWLEHGTGEMNDPLPAVEQVRRKRIEETPNNYSYRDSPRVRELTEWIDDTIGELPGELAGFFMDRGRRLTLWPGRSARFDYVSPRLVIEFKQGPDTAQLQSPSRAYDAALWQMALLAHVDQNLAHDRKYLLALLLNEDPTERHVEFIREMGQAARTINPRISVRMFSSPSETAEYIANIEA